MRGKQASEAYMDWVQALQAKEANPYSDLFAVREEQARLRLENLETEERIRKIRFLGKWG